MCVITLGVNKPATPRGCVPAPAGTAPTLTDRPRRLHTRGGLLKLPLCAGLIVVRPL